MHLVLADFMRVNQSYGNIVLYTVLKLCVDEITNTEAFCILGGVDFIHVSQSYGSSMMLYTILKLCVDENENTEAFCIEGEGGGDLLISISPVVVA